jgi:hypothetical protein
MQEMQKAPAGSEAVARLKALFAACALALAVGGCGTAIETPLPDVKAAASSSLTQAERDKAVAELNRKRVTHEQDAEQQIEQAR